MTNIKAALEKIFCSKIVITKLKEGRHLLETNALDHPFIVFNK